MAIITNPMINLPEIIVLSLRSGAVKISKLTVRMPHTMAIIAKILFNDSLFMPERVLYFKFNDFLSFRHHSTRLSVTISVIYRNFAKITHPVKN